MSILALYYRIGYGKQGLPWIVQSPAVWTVAAFMTAFSFSVFLVSTVLACIVIMTNMFERPNYSSAHQYHASGTSKLNLMDASMPPCSWSSRVPSMLLQISSC